MAMVDLKDLHRVKSKGRLYYYAWRGGPRLKSQPGTAAFIDELANAQATRRTGDKTKISGLCALYRSSPEWQGLSEKTKAEWGRWLTYIHTWFGDTRIKAFDNPQVRVHIKKWRAQWIDRPRSADMGIQVLSRLLSFGVSEGLLQNNACKGIPRLYSTDRSDLIWTTEDLELLAKHASKELMQAARLAALTGLRRGDLLRLSWGHVKAQSIEIATGKSGRQKTTLIPLYAELRAHLDSIPKRATTILTNTEGNPWRSGFAASWAAAFKRARLKDLHFHDLRGTAATRLFVAGFTLREIAEAMTWTEDKVERLIDRYVKRDEILLDRIRRLDEAEARTKAVKLRVKPT